MRVTIGIPFYNAERTLLDSIRSVFAQTYQDWELILLDDGSTDGSLEIARSIRDPRVRLISDGQNLKLSHRLNQIAGLARCAYLARMDADDVMHPDRIGRQVEFMDAHPEVDVLGTGTYTIDGANRPVGLRGCGPLDISAKSVIRSAPFIHPTVMGRHAWFRRYPYDTCCVRAEDTELWCRSFAHSRFAVLPEPLLFYREAGSIQLNKVLASYQSLREITFLYGPSLIGWPATCRGIINRRVKEIAWRILAPLGKEHLLISLRNKGLSPEQRSVAETTLKAILEFQIPANLPKRKDLKIMRGAA